MNIAYKGFDKNLRCRDFQYEIGKVYEMEDDIKICEKGFHYCKRLVDTMKYYDTKNGNRICKVEILGVEKTDDNKKFCTNKIKILEEIPTEEVLKEVNTGNYNTGYCNTGNCNTGDYNTGYCNTGFFNTNEPTIRMFNKGTKLYREDVDICRLNCILNFIDKRKTELVWKYRNEMTKDEIEKFPECNTIGGALMKIEVKVNVQEEWEKVSEEDKEFIKSLPNFDKDIFKVCTGIEV